MKERSHVSLSEGLYALDTEIRRIEQLTPDVFNNARHELNFFREAVINYYSAKIAVHYAQVQKLMFPCLLTR